MKNNQLSLILAAFILFQLGSITSSHLSGDDKALLLQATAPLVVDLLERKRCEDEEGEDL
jgi:hypothetical protein